MARGGEELARDGVDAAFALNGFQDDGRDVVADLVGVGPTRRSIRALRDEIAELEERIAEAEANAATLPHRRRYLLLVTEYLRGLLELQLELIEKV